MVKSVPPTVRYSCVTAVLFYVCEPTLQYKVTNKKDGKIYKMEEEEKKGSTSHLRL